MTELELWLVPAGFFLVLLAFLAGAVGQRHHLRRITTMTISEIVADVKTALQDAKSEIARLAPLEARVAELVAEGEAKVKELAAKDQELEEAKAALAELHTLVHPAEPPTEQPAG
jgi:hypothetical protein